MLVVGGGVAGFAAALAAARHGADTLLIERDGSLGGMATLALVSPMYGFWSGDNQVVRGIAQEVVEALERYPGGSLGHQLLGQCETCCQDEAKCPTYGVKRVAIVDTEVMKIVLPELLAAAGVRMLLYTQVVAPIVEGSLVRGVIAESKSGRFAVTAHTVIDCSGDGDVAAAAGAPFELGHATDGTAKPPSLFFRIGDTDAGEAPSLCRWRPGRRPAAAAALAGSGRVHRQFAVGHCRFRCHQHRQPDRSAPGHPAPDHPSRRVPAPARARL